MGSNSINRFGVFFIGKVKVMKYLQFRYFLDDLESINKKAFFDGVINFVEDGVTIAVKESLSLFDKDDINEILEKNGLEGSVDTNTIIIKLKEKS